MSSHPTANDHFRNRFPSAFWISLTVATVLHAALFLLSPRFALAERGSGERVMVGIGAPDVDVPEPPPPVRRPAEPVFVAPGVDAPDLTLDPNVPGSGRIELEPPAPERAGTDPVFTPYEIQPRLTNPGRVRVALRRSYPSVLRDAGIGGTARVWFHIDAAGRVMETRLDESSGYDVLDRAAMEVARRMEFTPAYNRDQPVAVWVSLAIRFEVE